MKHIHKTLGNVYIDHCNNCIYDIPTLSCTQQVASMATETMPAQTRASFKGMFFQEERERHPRLRR